MPAPFVWSAPAVTSQTQETEDSSQDGEYKLEFSATECLNALPPRLRESQDIASFKRSLKAHMA